jgi:hypothetical protein
MPETSVAVSPEFKKVVKWRISPVFVGRRIPDVKTESRLTRRERNSITRSSERLRHIVTTDADPRSDSALRSWMRRTINATPLQSVRLSRSIGSSPQHRGRQAEGQVTPWMYMGGEDVQQVELFSYGSFE